MGFSQITRVTPTRAAEDAFEIAIRGFTRDAGAGLCGDFRSRIAKAEMLTPSGIYIGTEPIVNIDRSRLSLFCTNIAKGLWVRNSLSLKNWDDFSIDIRWAHFRDNPGLWESDINQALYKPARYQEYWQEVLFYYGDYTPGDEVSIWSLWFYEAFAAFVVFKRKK